MSDEQDDQSRKGFIPYSYDELMKKQIKDLTDEDLAQLEVWRNAKGHFFKPGVTVRFRGSVMKVTGVFTGTVGSRKPTSSATPTEQWAPPARSLDRLLQTLLTRRFYKKIIGRHIADWHREAYDAHARGDGRAARVFIGVKHVALILIALVRRLITAAMFLAEVYKKLGGG